jgi:hypothetical protein
VTPAPDLAGFRDAQSRLRTQLGTDATFLIPTDAQWAPGEPIDPETHRPLDPFADRVPGTGEPREEVVRVTVVESLGTADDAELTVRGPVASDNIVLELDAADYPRVLRARHVDVWDTRYVVDEFRPSGFVGPDRYLAFVTKG